MKGLLASGSILVMAATGHAAPSAEPCTVSMDGDLVPGASFAKTGVGLVARLENPPRTRVVLSIDSADGPHYELVWDPVVNDGLVHEVLLPPAKSWKLSASATFDRVATETKVFTFGTLFGQPTKASDGARIVGENFVEEAGQAVSQQLGPQKIQQASGNEVLRKPPTLVVKCSTAQKDLANIVLSKRKVTAVARARGLLDQTLPAPVQSALTILGEIALDRARSGAMSLLRDKLVTPMCEELTFGLLGLAGGKGQILPRTCALAENVQLHDILSSGRPLLEAVSSDIRETLAPTLIASLPQLNDQMQTLAQLSLKLASSAIDGQLDGIVEIDYLVTLLDQLSWATGFDRNVAIVSEWVSQVSIGIIEQTVRDRLTADLQRNVPPYTAQPWAALPTCKVTAPASGPPQLDDPVACARSIVTTTDVKEVVSWRPPLNIGPYVVESALPASFEAPNVISGKPWENITACRSPKTFTTITGANVYEPADRTACVSAIASSIQGKDWIDIGINRGFFTIDHVIATARALSKRSFDDWLQTRWANAVSDLKTRSGIDLVAATQKYVQDTLVPSVTPALQTALDAACGFRLVVGIAKWCSSQDSCTAGEIAAILKDPTRVFTVSQRLPYAVCWKVDNQGNASYRIPSRIDRYIDLGVRLVAFLDPPLHGSERQRVLAMIAWMFDAIAELSPEQQETLTSIHDVIKHLIDHEYMAALSDSLRLAAKLKSFPKIPRAAQRALQLIGAVGSYARTYEETKNLDPKAAHEARRKSLESLIDASTDRRERGREPVFSLGANVGLGWSANRTFGVDEWPHPILNGEVAVRLPFGVSFQYLPLGLSERESHRRLRYFGIHAGLQLGDLGQFARGAADAVTWKSFVAPGMEAGILIGEPHRALTVTLHLSYVPEISDGAAPVWRYGLALGYYVPFFDLN